MGILKVLSFLFRYPVFPIIPIPFILSSDFDGMYSMEDNWMTTALMVLRYDH